MKTKKINIAGLLIAVIFSATAFAKETVNQTLEADPNGVVRIEHYTGEATIIGWDKAEVKVEGRLGEQTESFTFERSGSSIEIIVERESSGFGWNDSSYNQRDGDELTIHVPENSRVNYESVNADVSVESVLGGTTVEVVNGDVEVNKLAEKTNIETVNGDIKVRDLQGELSVESVNGEIDIQNVNGAQVEMSTVNGDINLTSTVSEVFAESVNGDIELNMGEVRLIETETVNGSIDMDMRLADAAVVEASSVGGNISLALPQDVSARFEIETFAGGSIRNTLTDHKPKKGEYGPRQWLNISTENPSATVEIESLNGSITLSAR